ncbi:MAG TPA: DUF6597 domain-containing transcriptional factor [Puia sp.]|uniref:DUF6597 domain-containing transcriptional factor n=1 Tax=Puia sp. TaxID=2045100 RepID=UPI002BE8B2DA|nr:DUF6597 domain-containing transcriptional factor [Puia sp.]HVU94863.1 DUF6597 domain-containing transcriptional factor [Puia sp.]
MHMESAPHPAMSDSIKCFWAITRRLPDENPVFEVLPDSYVELVFTFGTDFYLRQGEALIALPNPFLVGLLEKPIYLQASGMFTVVGVRLHP